MSKKIISLLLTGIMFFLLIPVNVRAANDGYLWPVANIYSMSRGYYSGHAGIDITAGGIAGTEVRATKSGTIIQSSNSCPHISIGDNRCNCNGGCGNFVKIQHDDGTYSRYLHFQQGSAHALGYVNQGDVIGRVGSSGDSSGYHLHFEIYNTSNVRINSNPTDGRHTYSGSHDAGNISYIYQTDSIAPTISNVKVTDVSSSGYTVTCTVADNVGVTSVSFPTWPYPDGSWQPVWHEGTISGNTATCRINVSDHGNIVNMNYATHIYAYDAAGNSSSSGADWIFIDGTAPKITNVRISDVTSTGYTIHFNIWDNDSLNRINFITWTPDRDGFDDKTETVQTAGFNSGVTSITHRVYTSDHNNEAGRYATHIYVYDNCGNMANVLLNACIGDECWKPTVMKYYDGHLYALYDTTYWNWSTAKTYCDSIGGYLVTITSAEEQAVIEELLKYGLRTDYWIGATDQYEENEWTWVTGEEMQYQNWSEGQPDNWDMIEDYGVVYKSNAHWNDVPEEVRDSNSDGVYGFICEMPHTHSYESEITKEATTTEEGIMTYLCNECGDSYTETIPKLDINEPSYDTYNITYHLDGGINHASNPMTYTSLNPYVDLKNPTKDGYVFEGWYTEKTGGEQVTKSTKLDGNINLYARWIPVSSGHVHNWNTDYTVDTEPNCIKTGSKSIHCSGCNETKDIVTIPSLGHEWDENISHDEVNHWYACKRCTETKDKARHSGNQSADGNTTVCEICGTSYETDLKLPFVDVYKDDWFYDSVFTNYFEGLMTGMDATHFGPYNSLSRAQFAVILHRMNGAPKMEYKSAFPDVPADTWYTDAVLWANEKGIITGYANGYFGAADNITREQMALMMYRYANSKNYDTDWKADFDTFKDAAKVSDFAQEALRWAVGNNIITGKENGTMLDPQGNASRAECATIINRFLNVY